MIDPGVAGAAGAGVPLIIWEVARFVVRRIGHAKTIPERMDRVEKHLVLHGDELEVIAHGLKANLEAAKGEINGNVDAALAELKSMEDRRNRFYRTSSLKGTCADVEVKDADK